MSTTEIDDVLARVRAQRALPPLPIRRHLREAAGLSQTEVGRLLHVGPWTISRYETGMRSPRGHLAVEYGDILSRLAQEVMR